MPSLRALKERLDILRRSRGCKILATIAVGFVFGIVTFAFVIAGEIYDYRDTVDGVRLPPVDAIVCLAGGRGRIAAAGDLWYRYWERRQEYYTQGRAVPVLYISGMGHASSWGTFARQLRDGVREMIPSAEVILEKESTNTDENARYLVKMAQEKGWRRVLLITSPYHMRRARFIFEAYLSRVGKIQPEGFRVETLSAFQEPYEPGEWRTSLQGIRVTLEEYLKWVYYRLFWKPIVL